MTEVQYFECENCGQVVQGWGASQDIKCCEKPNFVEIYGPQDEGRGSLALPTKWGNYKKQYFPRDPSYPPLRRMGD